MADKKVVEIETRVTGTAKAKSKLGSLGTFIKSRLVISVSDLARVFQFLGRQIKNVIGLVQEQEDADKRLEQSMKNLGIFSDKLFSKLKKQASAIQAVTTAGDEDLLKTQALLLAQGTQLDQLSDVTMATLDFATALELDLNGAAQLVAKTIGSSTNALTRYGIQVQGAVGSTERAKSAVEGIAKVFGGQASAAADTMSGRIKQLTAVWGDLLQELDGSDVLKEGAENLIIMVSALKDLASGDQFGLDRLTDDELLKRQEELNKQLIETNKIISDNKGLVKTKEDWGLIGQLFKAGKIDTLALNTALKDQITIQQELGAITKENEERKVEVVKVEEEILTQQMAIAKGNAEGQKAIYEAMLNSKAESEAKFNKNLIRTTEDTLSILASLQDSSTKEFFEIGKAAAIAQATIDSGAAIVKTMASVPFPFNIPLVTAQAALGASQIGKIEATRFAQGGQFERTNVSQTTSGQTAIDNEAGLERVTVEPIGQPDSAGSGRPIMLNINLDGKTLARKLYPEIRAIERSIT